MPNTHCPACRIAVEGEGGLMRCPLCGMLHHAACWERGAGCAVPLCGARVTREDGVATLASTRCHRCRGAEGRRFRFYYGHVRREWPELRPRYDIAGESETWLCDRCLHEGRGIAWAYMAVVAAVMCVLTPLGTAAAGVAGGYWRAGYTLDPPLPLVVAGCLVMAVAMPALLVRVALTRPLTRRRAEHINLMRHARKAMRARGITAILTPDQYARFQTQDRVRQVVGEM